MLRFGAVLMIIGGLIAIVMASLPYGARRNLLIPVKAGVPVTLPSSGVFSSLDLVLYGRADADRLPSDRELGCDVTSADGHDVGLNVSTLAALEAGKRTIGSDMLTPLTTVSSFAGGDVLTCSGPAARAAQPLYLVKDRRSPVPRLFVAAFGVFIIFFGVASWFVLRAVDPSRSDSAWRSGADRVRPS